MRTLLALAVALYVAGAIDLEAQDWNSSVQVEVFGIGGFGALSYEASRSVGKDLAVGGKLAFSFVPIDANNGVVLIFPITATARWYAGDHAVAGEIGQAFSITTKGNWHVLMPVSLGYRFEPRDANYFVQLAYTPLISYLYDVQVQHWGGLAFGWRWGGRP